MTFQQYCIDSEVALSQLPSYRKGQIYFVTLDKMKPMLASLIRGTDIDPFYNDTKFDAFLSYVYDNWDKVVEWQTLGT